jgi:multicomponent Na+:H+ antiporter subunit D
VTPGELALLALAIPAAGMPLIAAAGARENLREAISFAASVTLFLTVLSLAPPVLAGERPEARILEMLPGIAIALKVEPLGWLFAAVASSLWVVSTGYSIGYMRGNKERKQTRFYVCFAGAIAAAIGIAFAGNLLTLFLFYEMLTLITYPLVTHHGTEEARRAGRVYLGILIGTSVVLLLPAVIWTWVLAGSLDFVPGGLLAGRTDALVTTVLLALYMFGIGKAALMPFHRWLPAAMVAPTPVSALLHAVAVVKAGVFTVLKVVVYVFGVDSLSALGGAWWLTAIAGFTIVAASVVALFADNLKRRLAYSTVSQLSYIVLAASMLTPLAIAGAALHLVAHAFSKITLFFVAGAIYTAAHKTAVSELDGIGRRMPWTMGAFTVGALSLIGIPPFIGIVSKWYIVHGVFEAQSWLAPAVLLASSLLNAAYFLPIVYVAFFKAPAGHAHGEAPLPMVVALTVTAAATVALFFFPGLPLALARDLAGL